MPKVGDKLVIHSTGTVTSSGAVFDDSRESGMAHTVAVGVNKTLQGMDTALLEMRKGCRRRLLITADLAYGKEGLRPHVPPNADIIYDVEVVDINETLVSQGIRAR
jgi:FKBP-type peptidyl-prolyl cis-trans isomerase